MIRVVVQDHAAIKRNEAITTAFGAFNIAPDLQRRGSLLHQKLQLKDYEKGLRRQSLEEDYDTVF